MTGEDRLRQLMRDPGWSLPAWPDAQVRVRRAARRQRLTAAGVAAAAAAVIATAALVPVALLSTSSAPVATGDQQGSAHATTHPQPPGSPVIPPESSGPPVIPPVGSAGFPATIYPAAAQPRAVTGVLTLCPDPAGVEVPGPATPAAARIVLNRLGRGFTSDLHLSDRSAWPLLASSWQPDGIRLFARSARTSVRYSGPLHSSPGVPADIRQAVVAGCGWRVARATWVIVYGPARKPALDGDILFLTRRGHMLFYSAE